MVMRGSQGNSENSTVTSDSDSWDSEYGGRSVVEMQKVSFRYHANSPWILHRMDIHAVEGDLFAVLGPSGAGKSTILKALLGVHKPSFGLCTVFGKVPGAKGSVVPGKAVGYMPQETALYEDLSIDEVLGFYKRLNHVTDEDFERRREEVQTILSLPEGTRVVNTLSGGQKRRLSLAVVLIHRPALLILDEPTVGVDPLLRYQIWNHLKQLSQEEQVTIMITTHHLDEAENASRMLLIRKGRKLTEGSPQQLLAAFGSASVEALFIALCQKDNEKEEEERKSIGHSRQFKDEQDRRKSVGHEVSGNFNYRSVDEDLRLEAEKSIAHRRRKRDRIKSFIFKGSPQQRRKSSEASRRKSSIRTIATVESVGTSFRATRERTTVHDLLDSCEFVDEEDEVVEGEQDELVADTHEAQVSGTWHDWKNQLWEDQKVKFPKPRGYVLKALNYRTFHRLRRDTIVLLFQFFLPAIQIALFALCIGPDPQGLCLGVVNNDFSLTVDPLYSVDYIESLKVGELKYEIREFSTDAEASQAMESGDAYGYVSFGETFSDNVEQRLSSPLTAHTASELADIHRNSTIGVFLDFSNQHIVDSMMKELNTQWNLLALRRAPQNINFTALSTLPFQAGVGAVDTTFTDFIAPGMIVAIAFAQAITLTAMSFINEKIDGTMSRIWASGTRAVEVMMSAIMSQFVVLVVESALMLFVALVIFEVNLQGNLAEVAVILLAVSFDGMVYGLLISSGSKTQDEAIQKSLGSFMPSLLLSGVLWPLESIPWGLRWLSFCIPTTWAGRALQNIFLRDYSFGDADVWQSFVFCVGWGLLVLALSGRALRG